jgi:uncharacterized protein (DUF1778 family)
MTTSATQRLELRLRPEADRQLREAAEIAQTSVSKLLLDAGLERAQEIIDSQRTWRVSESFFEELLSALDAPPVINQALKKAREQADLMIERR